MLEAMSCNVPITSNTSSMPEVSGAHINPLTGRNYPAYRNLYRTQRIENHFATRV
jgi:hypothetical protein